MAFPVELASILTGASVNTLRRWSRQELISPELSPSRPMLYSFRDLVALRSVCYLRSEISLQKIRKAIAHLPEQHFTEHLSEYKFATDGATVVVWTDSGFVDLVRNPGQFHFVTLREIYRPFLNQARKEVVDFEHPRQTIEVAPGRLGGFPTIVGTRVPYDTVAKLQRGPNALPPEDIQRFFPGVSKAAALDAANLADEVEAAAA
ncbi:DUF433 domain-containing protein [Mycolicibacterium smegmatis]|uniref:DUF433 domain-containing protein n=1 Tax=Mycolicibacterium smegmatis TaxID=1772 RepID=UPI001E429E1A|nr:DUF433 domain-containing protein [Mycolicibacterium smegmatis]UGU29877.1 DUF433 domain-containing protein [Mycolicibacterium smegmatis]ULN70814.1 DUF433 domain-containing protein [Mycolicibacterium smegmatis]